MTATTSTEADPDNPPVQRGLVAVLSRDLFFGMRIRTSLRKLGYIVAIAQDPATFGNHLVQGDQRASLGIVDFNGPVDWESLRLAIDSGVPIIAFGPHTDVEGFRAARAAGVTRTISNGEFSRSLPDLAQRYAVPGN
ncbi:MAG TPA: hypothetical protein VD767_02205 [Thermomicrobiales bacterium]|nr:hypothetical protein [Thermomicrobiales bacterium]